MVLTDQQLRQELIGFGETVPPVTQRNREQLRARLELLRSQTRTRAHASPSRVHTTVSPLRTSAKASPSKTPLATGSPSRITRNAASPSIPAAASPTRATASPSRTRSSVLNTSRPSTRSQQATNLIELSDSDTDIANALTLRSTRSGQTTPNMQTRSNGSRRAKDSPTVSSSSSGVSSPPNITTDVEQSIARHRREIKQLLDSVRDRNRVTNTNMSNPVEPTGTPIRLATKTLAESQITTNIDQNLNVPSTQESNQQQQKPLSLVNCLKRHIQSLWCKYGNFLKNILKLLLITFLFSGITCLMVNKYHHFVSQQQPIYCSIKNATECKNMTLVIAAVRQQLQTRTGENECNSRSSSDIIINRDEIETNLNEKNLKFNLGDDERWKTLITYILNGKANDIDVWDKYRIKTDVVTNATGLSTKIALRSFKCRTKQDISPTTQNLMLIIIVTIGLLTLTWYFQRLNKGRKENEEIFHNLIENVIQLLDEQYEKHLHDPKTQPWIAINHIREKLISVTDQDKLKLIWERVKNQITNEKSKIITDIEEINGENVDVWRMAKVSPMKTRSQTAKKSIEEIINEPTSEIGLTECLKLRNFLPTDHSANEKDIENVTKAIQNRCENVKQLEHIGNHSTFVYVKFSSKEAAGQAYDLLNNWNFEGRIINVKYIRHNRYNEHFPEARNTSPKI